MLDVFHAMINEFLCMNVAVISSVQHRAPHTYETFLLDYNDIEFVFILLIIADSVAIILFKLE